MNVVIFRSECSGVSDINMNILSSSQLGIGSDDDNIRDNSDMHCGTWTKLGAERPHFLS
jgi:hypothetical protein